MLHILCNLDYVAVVIAALYHMRILYHTRMAAAEEVVNMRGGWADPDLFL